MEAYDHSVLDQSATEIVDTAKRRGPMFGADPSAYAH